MEDPPPKPVAKAKEPNIFCNKFRYFILILGTLCMTSIFSNMITLNFTIICMDSQNKTGTVFEGTEQRTDGSVFEPKKISAGTAHTVIQRFKGSYAEDKLENWKKLAANAELENVGIFAESTKEHPDDLPSDRRRLTSPIEAMIKQKHKERKTAEIIRQDLQIARFHDYSPYEKTMLQWTVSISAMIATFPFTWLCTQFGARYVFFASGMLSTFSTAIIPLSSALGLGWFIAVRVLQGLAYASDFAVIGVLCTRWASLRENAKFLGVLTCFSPLSSVLTNAVSGVICDSPALGWPWVHYVHAMASFVLFMAWLFFYTDCPQQNSFITADELAAIYKNKTEAHKHRETFVPYLELLKDKIVWSVWLNAFADIFSGYFLIIYAPTYLKKVLQYSTTETGFFGALIAGVHIPIKLGAGYISDSFNCLPERKKMWIFNSIALLCPAAIYIYACYAPLDHPFITVLLFGGVHATLGFNCGGFYKCGALVSRQYAEVVIAFTQFIKCSVFFIAPALMALLVQNETNGHEWHTIFYIIAGSLVFSNAVFCVYATDQPCEFTKITKQSRISEKEKKNGTAMHKDV